MDKANLSRRAMLAGTTVALASPVAVLPALAGTPEPDPVHAAIERHRAAYEAHGIACDEASAVEQEAIDAGIRWDDHPGMAVAEERQGDACREDNDALWELAPRSRPP